MERNELLLLASNIKLALTDCDGVLTDSTVYYSDNGEVMKRFSVRDGMGVERLRKLFEIQTGIVTGETSPSVVKRAEKLKITELHLGAKNKAALLDEILQRHGLQASQVAFIGDDVNDFDVMQKVGFAACPADAMPQIKTIAHYRCKAIGGHGAFRELAEFIIEACTLHHPYSLLNQHKN